jgi:acetyltransferase-like isoleucine patch superfamily enzyme
MRNLIISFLRFYYSSKFITIWRRLNNEAKLPVFGSKGKGTNINQPFYSGNTKEVLIGSDCNIGIGCDFGVVYNEREKGKIRIGNNVWITSRCQIYSKIGIDIEDNVMIASNVFICDYSHGKSSPNIPYKDQLYEPFGEIKIGSGTWIGQNVVILHGVNIGKQSIIGANSVVTNSIPDYSIAVGSPAKVVRVWDFEHESWVKPK